jgi:hypothetical protein
LSVTTRGVSNGSITRAFSLFFDMDPPRNQVNKKEGSERRCNAPLEASR